MHFDLKSLEKKFASTKDWSLGEQASVNHASKRTIQELSDLNHKYEEKNDFIFIVCATGKSASEMLMLLKERIDNSTEEEIINAAEEQRKITHIRIEKLLS